ncbi:hypothetical protein RBH29_13850, partial [Herbivorax sp. ANBcel31]|uniref:hypothetical protein n=1 Tax=Herbivorax sp. ANBcel31 TaxID=3069754 RepID=UPI0027B2FB1E
GYGLKFDIYPMRHNFGEIQRFEEDVKGVEKYNSPSHTRLDIPVIRHRILKSISKFGTDLTRKYD